MCDGCLLPPPWARHCRSYVLARSVPSPRSTVECLARTSSLTHHMRSVPCVLFVCFRGCGGSTPEEPPVFATQQDEAYQNPTQAQQIDDIKFSIARAENMAVEAVITIHQNLSGLVRLCAVARATQLSAGLFHLCMHTGTREGHLSQLRPRSTTWPRGRRCRHGRLLQPAAAAQPEAQVADRNGRCGGSARVLQRRLAWDVHQ